jgi:hypothetical protein
MSNLPIVPICDLWHSRDAKEWDVALERYWDLIPCDNVALEKEMEQLNPERIRQMSPNQWFNFLRDKYFPWKFTQCNLREANLSRLRQKGETENGRQELHRIKEQILSIDCENIHDSICVVSQIPGLATAGASGLLALLYPKKFGTVDQFVVKALRGIPDLPEALAIARMKEKNLKCDDGEVLVKIMRRHAGVLTSALGKRWRPRDVDKVLWTYGRE